MVAIRVIHDEGADRDVPLPSYETAGAAGADVRANLPDRGCLFHPHLNDQGFALGL